VGSGKSLVQKKTNKERINSSSLAIANTEESTTLSNVILKKANAKILSKIKESRIGGLSINQFLNKKEAEEHSEKEITPITGEDRKEFNQDQLNKLWIEYAKIIQEKGKVSLFRLFSAQFPKIDKDYLLHFPVESHALAEDLKAEKPALLSYLRKSLSNFGINIDFPLPANEETLTLYTAEDKFKHMLEKQPQLIYLKKLLVLELN
jgi:DNA polymerase-3 subunit gamma/tau